MGELLLRNVGNHRQKWVNVSLGLGVAGRWALTFRGYLQFKERRENKNHLEIQREETEGEKWKD